MLLWDPRDGRQTARMVVGHPRGPSYLAFSPDGRTVAGNSDGRLELVDVQTGQVRSLPVDDQVGPLSYSTDGSLLFAGIRDGSIRTWDVKERRVIRNVQGHAGLVLGLAVSPDGITMVSAGEDKTIRLWDVATFQELMCLTECRARVNSVAFSPDGMMVAAADHSGAVTIWDARSRR